MSEIGSINPALAKHSPDSVFQSPLDIVGEVMLTRTLQDSFPPLQTGSKLNMLVRGRSVPVEVVGIVEEIGAPVIYANFATFEAVTALGDQASSVRIKARGDQLELAVSALDRVYLEANLPPGQIISRATIRDALDEHFKVVGDVIRMGARAAALVGAIVLAPPSAIADRWARRLEDPVVALASGWMRVRQRAKSRGVELPLVWRYFA